MGVNIRMVRAAAITSGGPTQDFTVPGMGTPKAAIFIVTGATANAVSSAGAAIAFGFTTGAANRFCITASSQDAPSPSNANTANRKTNIKCISLLAANATLDAEADFVSWDPGGVNGVRITWSNFPTTAVLITCILLAGDDFSAYAGDFLASEFVNRDTVVTDPGFPPDQLIVLGTRGTSGYEATTTTASMQIGFADRDVPAAQCSSSWYAEHGTNASNQHNYVSNNRAQIGVNPAASPVILGQVAIEINTFSATGFTATTRTAGQAIRYPYLALKYNGPNGSCGHTTFVDDAPNAPGTVVQASVVKPQFVMQLTSGMNIINEQRISFTPSLPGAGSYGIAAFTATEMFSHCIGDDDANAQIDTESFASNDFRCRSDAQVNLHVATFVSFDAASWTLNYSSVVAAGSGFRKWASLVVGEFASTANKIPVIQNAYRQRRAG